MTGTARWIIKWNTVVSVAKNLVAKVKSLSSTLVVCEATGGCKHVLVDGEHEAGIPVCIANPCQVRGFAKRLGYLEKTTSLASE